MTTALIENPDLTRPLELGKLFPCPAPLELDVGCGKGRFLIARAKRFPDRNFIGIDRMLSRLRRVEKKAKNHGLPHIKLLRLEAAYSIAYLLPAESVATVHVFFPDPWPKRRHHRRRLFTKPFPSDLLRILQNGGRINVATDHADYFTEIHRLLTDDQRYSEVEPYIPEPDERTDFEILFLGKGKSIARCSFVKGDPSSHSNYAPKAVASIERSLGTMAS